MMDRISEFSIADSEMYSDPWPKCCYQLVKPLPRGRMGVESISRYRGGKYSVSKPRALSADSFIRWGLGVMLGIYVAGDSGGFLNPAITFCFCTCI